MENFHLNPLVCESVNLLSSKTGGEICLEQNGQILTGCLCIIINLDKNPKNHYGGGNINNYTSYYTDTINCTFIYLFIYIIILKLSKFNSIRKKNEKL